MLGRYDNGIGKIWDDPNYMKFYNDGYVTFPFLSDGMWFMTPAPALGPARRKTRTTWRWRRR